jgi:hypothetical protein
MELDSIVDYFVIAEANTSHNGTPKEFIFEKNKSRYKKKWLDKTIYIKITDMPPYDEKDIFKLEYFQRRQVMRGLHGRAKIGDKILLSDCDEIPSIKAIKDNLDNHNWMLFKQILFYYYVNNMVKRGWGGTVMAEFGSFGNDPQRLRAFAKRHSWAKTGEHIILDGGWHYSYMTGGNAKRVRNKIALFAEKHLLQIAGSVDDVKRKISTHKDLYDREPVKVSYIQSIVDISKNKPRMLDKFLKKYPNFIYRN